MASINDYVRLFVVTSLLTIVTSNMNQLMMFQVICNDDFSHIGSISTDCNKFVICSQGMALGFSCPRGYVFNDFIMRCHLPSNADKARCSKMLLANMPTTCLHSPHSRVASYLSCAQYFDCAARPSAPHGFMSYVTECPYPKLFSPETGRCEPFQRVQCVGRTEPKAPCDYLQYQQLCEGPNCPPCSKRHPSCVGLSDGSHSIGKVSRIYVVCLAERTVNIGICKSGYVFSDAKKTCVPRAPPRLPFIPPPLSSLSANQIAALLSGLSSRMAANKTIDSGINRNNHPSVYNLNTNNDSSSSNTNNNNNSNNKNSNDNNNNISNTGENGDHKYRKAGENGTL